MDNIPINCLDHIVKFLGPVECANIAQTCKTLNILIYQRDIWKKFIWIPKCSNAFYKIPPIGSCHYGSCYALCFYAWLTYAIQSDIPLLPLNVLEKIEDEAFVKAAYIFWRKTNEPCVIPIHHNVWDLCKLRPVLVDSSQVEQATVFHHIATTNQRNYNHYSSYLTTLIEQVNKEYPSVALVERTGIEIVYLRYSLVKESRRVYLRELLHKIIAKHTKSNYKIRTIGCHSFETNKTKAYYG